MLPSTYNSALNNYNRSPQYGWSNPISNQDFGEIIYEIPNNTALRMIILSAEKGNQYSVIFHFNQDSETLKQILIDTPCELDTIQSKHFRHIHIEKVMFVQLLNKISGFIGEVLQKDIETSLEDKNLQARRDQQTALELQKAREWAEFQARFGAQLQKEQQEQALLEEKLNALLYDLLNNTDYEYKFNKIKNLSTKESDEVYVYAWKWLRHKIPTNVIFKLDDASALHYFQLLARFKEIATILSSLNIRTKDAHLDLLQEITITENKLIAKRKPEVNTHEPSSYIPRNSGYGF